MALSVDIGLVTGASSPMSPRVSTGHAISVRVRGREAGAGAAHTRMAPVRPGRRIEVGRDLAPLNGVIVQVEIVHHMHHVPRDLFSVIQHFLRALILAGSNHLAIWIELKISQGSIRSRPVFVPHRMGKGSLVNITFLVNTGAL